MAEEVYGNIGDQPVHFTNAASEVTLNKLLAMNAQMAKKMGVKTDFEIKQIKKTEIELKKLAKVTKDEFVLLTKVNKERKKELEQLKEKQEKDEKSAKVSADLTKNFNLLSKNLSGTISAIINVSNSLATMGNSITSATQMLTHIPIIGAKLSAALSAVAGAAERTQKSFQQSASVGANFNGSFRQMIDAASGAGLTFDQFSSVIQQSGASLALLGKGSEDGAIQLGKYVKQLRTINNGDLQGQLAGLGFTAESIAENFAAYGASMARIGRLQAMSNEELIYSTADYLKNLSAVSKLTGEDRKSLEKRQQDMMNDSQFRSMMMGQEEETFKNVNLLMAGLPETTAKAFKEVAAIGTARSEGARALAIQNPELFQAAQQLNQTLQRRDKFTEAEATQIHKSTQERARVNTADMNALSGFLGRLGDTTQQQIALDAQNIASQTTTLKAMKDAADAAPAETEAAKLLRTQQELAKSSNEINKSLLGFVDKLLPVMDKFNTLVQDTVAPALDYFSDNLLALGGTILGITGLTIAAEMAAAAAGGYVAGKIGGGKGAPGGKAAGGMTALFRTIATFMFSGPGLAIMAAAGLAYALYKIIDDGDELRRQDQERKDDIGTQYKNVTGQTGLPTDRLDRRIAISEQTIKSLEDKISKEKEVTGGPNDVRLANFKKELDANIKGLARLKKIQRERDMHSGDTPPSHIGSVRPEMNPEDDMTGSLIAATEELTKATQANTKETKNASSCDLDYSSPQALFNSFAKLIVGGGPELSPGTSVTQRPLSHIGGGQSVFSGDIQGLSDLIYSAEGTSNERARQHGLASGYDVSYGYGEFASSDKPLSEMTIAEVKEFQKRQIAATRGKIPGTDQGTGAVGKAQITQGTLADLQKQMGFKDTDVFSPELQDQMMVKLLERSGLKDFQSGKITADQFQDRIAGTWASIGKSGTGKSAYGQPTSKSATANLAQVLEGVKNVTPSSSQATAAVAPDSGTAGGTTPNELSPEAPAATPINTSANELPSLNTTIAQMAGYNKEMVQLLKNANSTLKSLSTVV